MSRDRIAWLAREIAGVLVMTAALLPPVGCTGFHRRKRMTRRESAAIAGLSFLACAAIACVVIAQGLLLRYGPTIRAFLLDQSPGIGVGMVIMAACSILAGLCLMGGSK